MNYRNKNHNFLSRLSYRLLNVGLITFLAFGLMVSPSSASSPEPYLDVSQQAKLSSDDTGLWNAFGKSVDIDGDTAVVGEPLGGFLGANGTAQVFIRDGDDNWGLPYVLEPSDIEDSAYFGNSVAIDGDTIVVGAYSEDANGKTEAGAVYIFTRTESSWNQQAKLTASDAQDHDHFGNTVAIHGDTVVVGARFEDPNLGSGPITDAGSVYVFVREGSTLTQQAKLVASDAQLEDLFGHSVAIFGNFIVVGAIYEDPFIGGNWLNSAGSVYIFKRAGSVWTPQGKLNAPDAKKKDHFGSSVAIDQSTIVIGAQYDDHSGQTNIGSAYVYDNLGGIWTPVAKLTPADTTFIFGSSVAVSGNAVIVGAPNDDDFGSKSGAAYLFSRHQGGANNWGQGAKLTASDAGADDTFGNDVGFDGVTIVVGAHDKDYNSITDAGAAYVFLIEPVPNDTIGAYDPSTGQYQLRNTNDAGSPDLDFTFAADLTDGIPLAGDWDGNGVDTIGVFSPSLGEFRLRNTNDTGPADITLTHPNMVSALPLVGDWNGDGVDTLGIYLDGKVFLRNNNSIGKPDPAFFFGGPGLIPLSGDWNGDGIDTIGVFDPLNGEFQLRNSNSSGPADITISHKLLIGAEPLVGNWDGYGKDTLGIYRDGQIYILNTNTLGPPDLTFTYGGTGLLPITGDWDGS